MGDRKASRGSRAGHTSTAAAPATERGTPATREAIVSAALAEFGAKGYSGARTASIAARAGVNQQLISYYFGGKKGLLDELHRRWAEAEARLAPQDRSFADAIAGYVDATLDHADWAKLVVWRALGDHPGEYDDLADAQRARARARLERIRRRQVDGEITDAVDPEFILLLAYAVALAPIALGDVVEEIFGVDGFSTEYRTIVVEQLARIVGAAPPDDHATINAGSSA